MTELNIKIWNTNSSYFMMKAVQNYLIAVSLGIRVTLHRSVIHQQSATFITISCFIDIAVGMYSK